jgi:hypothetical protein
MVKEHVVSIVISAIVLASASSTPLVYGESDKPSTPRAQTLNAEKDVATKVERSSKYPIIGSLETKKGTIVIMSGPDGPLYNVKNKRGLVVSRELSDRELQARHPEIYSHFQGAIAGRTVWAGM